MKLKVVKQFKDKNDHKTIYQVGDVINIKEVERVTNLIKRDLCIPIEDEEKEATTAEAQPKTDPAEAQPEADPAEEKPKRGTRKSGKAESKQEE